MAIHHKTHVFSRRLERLFLAATTGVLLLLFGSLYYHLLPQLEAAQQGYANGSVIQLAPPLDPARLSALVRAQNYLEDPRDVAFLSQQLAQKLQTYGGLANLGALNKKDFAVPVALVAAAGGPNYQGRLQAARMALGFTTEDSLGTTVFDSLLFAQESGASALTHPSAVRVGKGVGVISGTVRSDSTNGPLSGLLVGLQPHVAKDSLALPPSYARTDAQGTFRFEGLPQGDAFSVLPMHPIWEFGPSQNTDSLTENLNFEFKAKHQTLRLLGAVTYQQVKEDKTLTVRTPDNFKGLFLTWTLVFFVAFWAVHLFWTARRFEGDNLILPLLMLLTGTSTLMMFGIQDPLRDLLRGPETVQGVAVGLLLLAVLSQLPLGRWYSTRSFDILAWRQKSVVNQVGYTWLIAALLLTALVAVFGTGPEGSGVKVNLNVGLFTFQPSEITKYLVLLYFAGYFTANAEYLRQVPSLRWRIKNSLSIFGSFVLLLGMYLLALGDMGPALVLCFTFLLFYAAARGDFGFMAFGGAVYGVMLALVSKLGIAPDQKLPFVAITVLYGLLWAAHGFFKKDYKESALFIVLLIAAFVFGDLIPEAGERLANRNQMYLNPWDNESSGGDHVAHGIWALASGGLTGQGLGKGFSKVMPAHHTDMILPTIGEELGLLGLIAVFVAMGFLLHRTLLIARRNAQPFSFYLCAGVALVVGSQFLLIASGSMGTVPLTGVSVPFLSFGRVSMIINIAAFGAVMAVSATEGTSLQKDYIQSRFDRIIASGSFTFSLGILKFIAFVLLPYQVFRASSYIVKSTVVANRNGERIMSINPRINILTRALGAGNIYDRNGLLLASSDLVQVRQQRDSLRSAGASDIDNLLNKRLLRYYPFDNHLYFWVGDYNNRLLSGNSNGYFAEFMHLAQLRGFDTTPEQALRPEITASATRYRESRFLPRHRQDFQLTQYDYSALAPLLRAGIDSRATETFKAQNRDVQLTVDASLQTQLQRQIQASEFANKRVSVVLLNAQTGEVLASAVHPLPDVNLLKQWAEMPQGQQKLMSNLTKLNGQLFTEKDLGMTYETPPGSTAKVLTGFAALNRLGTAGVNTTYNVTMNERIRTTGNEPDPTGPVDMRKAIVQSSNVYFIRIANELNLDPEMQTLYEAVGMRLAGKGGYHFYQDSTYFAQNRAHWNAEVFAESRGFYTEPSRSGTKLRFNGEFSKIAWGQGKLEATPLALGRMVATIANGGTLQPSRFAMNQNGKPIPMATPQVLAQHQGTSALLEEFMREQSRTKITDLGVAGKTGTPEREVVLTYFKDAQGRYLKDKKGDLLKESKERNDALYTFFAQSPRLNAPLVAVVRIERLNGQGSGQAVKLAKEIVVPTLLGTRYFERSIR